MQPMTDSEVAECIIYWSDGAYRYAGPETPEDALAFAALRELLDRQVDLERRLARFEEEHRHG